MPKPHQTPTEKFQADQFAFKELMTAIVDQAVPLHTDYVDFDDVSKKCKALTVAALACSRSQVAMWRQQRDEARETRAEGHALS